MDEEACLLVISNSKDEDGFPTEQRQEIPVFVREKSVTRAEFYEAMRSGVSVKMMFEMRLEDWELSAHFVSGKKEYASQIEYAGEIYRIIRAYKKTRSMIEITCC